MAYMFFSNVKKALEEFYFLWKVMQLWLKMPLEHWVKTQAGVLLLEKLFKVLILALCELG